DQRSRARRIAQDDRRADRERLERAAGLAEDEVEGAEHPLRRGDRAADARADRLERDPEPPAGLGSDLQVAALGRVVAEDESALGRPRQRAARAEALEIDGVLEQAN